MKKENFLTVKTSMVNRIKQFIDSESISTRGFEQRIKASNGLIRKAIANQTDIQSKWLTAIVDNYPQISIEWLLTGKGEMLRKDINLNTPMDEEYFKRRYIQNIESENKYLLVQIEELKIDIKKKQELIDAFLSGSISTITASNK